MLRLGLLVSVVPLVLAGGVAPAWLSSTSQPCIQNGRTIVQMARFPWQGDLHVAFTGNPDAASVRVQLVDQPDLADFVVTDDVGTSEESSCAATPTAHLVSIVTRAELGEPTIYLSHDAGADYRIFVQSTSFTPHQAAALIVGAHRGQTRLAAAAR
jgi:hypothetical protein